MGPAGEGCSGLTGPPQGLGGAPLQGVRRDMAVVAQGEADCLACFISFVMNMAEQAGCCDLFRRQASNICQVTVIIAEKKSLLIVIAVLASVSYN